MIISSPNRLITSPRCKTLQHKPKNVFHTQEFTIPELSSCLHEAGFKVDETLYGQKYQRYFKNRLLKNIHRELFKPGHKLDAEVTIPPKNKAPRYFILTAS